MVVKKISDGLDPRLNSPSFVLPSFESAPQVIRMGLFTWEVEPFVQGTPRSIILHCTDCSYVNKSKKSTVNSTNLKSHWINKHSEHLHLLKENYLASGLARDEKVNLMKPKKLRKVPMSMKDTESNQTKAVIDTTLKKTMSLPVITASVTSANVTSDTTSSYDVFDPKIYSTKFYEYLSANDLPLDHVESPSLNDLINYGRRCTAQSLPELSLASMKLNLETKYNEEMNILKRRLANHQGKFSLTIDEWKFRNQHNFLSITLHLLNDDFVLEKYVIGFEPLKKDVPSYEYIDRVLSEYGINDRIISITRDNAEPINDLMKSYKDQVVENDTSLKFNGDIRCAGHVFHLATKAFLSCIFFKTNKSETFREALESATEANPESVNLFHRMKNVPKLLNQIIQGTHNNEFLRSTFQTLVEDRKTKEGNNTSPDVLLKVKDNQWVKVLERFLYFRPEITELLKRARNSSLSIQESFKLKSFEIDDLTWKYLSDICKILSLFLEATTVLQSEDKETSNMIIPYVCGISKGLDAWQSREIAQSNPLVSLGLRQAREKLLQYYPVYADDIRPLANLYLATVLDPHFKLGVFEDLGLPNSLASAIQKNFLEVYRSYKQELAENNIHKHKRLKADQASNQPDQYGSIMELFYADKDVVDGGDDDDAEFRQYLAERRVERSFTIREYYKCYKASYPTIYRMAKDYLSMVAMSAPSESLFTRVQKVFTDKRNEDPDTIKMFLISRSRDLLKEEVNGVSDSTKSYQEDKETASSDSTYVYASGEVSVIISSENEDSVDEDETV